MRIGISCNAPRFRFLPRFPSGIETRQVRSRFVPKRWQAALFSWRMQQARQRAGVDVLIACNRVAGADMVICGGTHKGYLAATGRAASDRDVRTIALESRAYEQASVVMAHSRLMRDELIALYGLDETKISVLHPPVDGARFCPPDPQRRAVLCQQYGFGEQETVLLFPSSSHKRKGLDQIVQALGKMNLPVVLAGRIQTGKK